MECKNCQKDFQVLEADRQFLRKFGMPDPDMCADCRLQQRLCFRNERTFYRRKSDLTGQPTISIYHQDAPYKVYSRDEWWSDKWDGLDYGRDFDFNRGFFEQFNELLHDVPRIALFNVNPTNSDYCQQAYDNKGCYMCMVVEKCEDSMYCTHSNEIRDCFDCSYMHNSELCYECLDSEKLYNCVGCQSCQNSSELIFCYDCIGCQNCIGCHGLRNKQYHIMNKPYSKEDYFAKLVSLGLSSHSKYVNAKGYFGEFLKSRPQRASRNLNTEDSTGNYLINTQNCHECFDSFDLQDCRYNTWIFHSHDCMDVYGMGHGEWVYAGLGVENLNNCGVNTFVSDSSDAFYSDCSFYSMYLFGCAGLRNKKYCIFNKQYSPEDYEELKGRIIEHMKKTGEWGQFFPVNLSPFAYNETAANYYFPLEKGAVWAKGYKWRDPEPKDYLPASVEVPDDSKECGQEICNGLMACSDCGKNYKIQMGELMFYKKRGLPVPRKCIDCRYRERFGIRNPRYLWDRDCGRCHKGIRTSFSPGRKEQIVCEECYRETIS